MVLHFPVAIQDSIAPKTDIRMTIGKICLLYTSISVKNTAVKIPIGTPMIIAPTVPQIEAKIKGKIPN